MAIFSPEVVVERKFGHYYGSKLAPRFLKTISTLVVLTFSRLMIVFSPVKGQFSGCGIL